MLTFVGEFSASDLPTCSQKIDELFEAGEIKMVFNLRLLIFIRSSAVGYFLKVKKRRQDSGGDLVLVMKSEFIRRVVTSGSSPGSMGERTFVVRGLGNPEGFRSCSHGAGRVMSRGEARRRFSVADHAAATRGVECRKDAEVLDETPGAYKPLPAVMAAQRDLVEAVHELRQVVCVKG